MSPVRSRQQVLLTPATALLQHVVAEADGDPQAARDVVEAAAGRLGGFDLDGYRQLLRIDARLDTGRAMTEAGRLLDLLERSGLPRRTALATLAQPALTELRRRSTGAYYTDFRLARYLAQRTAQLAATALTAASTVLDPAAGTGVLLVALAEEIGRDDPGARRELVATGLSAVDLDPACRSGTVAALASLTTDLAAIGSMAQRVRTADSLTAGPALWDGLRRDGQFDAVIGNPPWERLRVTRHETLLAGGSRRHYGADYGPEPPDAGSGGAGSGDGGSSSTDLARMRRYVHDLAARYPLLDAREIDLSHAFLALGWSLVRAGGSLGMLMPAGLIRAQGTRSLREHLLTTATEVDLTVLHNGSRFFGIDTRCKFLVVCAQFRGPRRAGPRRTGARLHFRHSGFRSGSGGDTHHVPTPVPLLLGYDELAAVRPDLTVPEVTGNREWQLFRHLAACGYRPGDPRGPWAMRITREVDMTRSRPLFRRTPGPADVPVVEGRMVHQYRSRAKTYASGTGRSAIWRPLALGQAAGARPQFFVDPGRLPDAVQERISRPRIGFCDIVGQTNERTLQAALIEPARVCGNKVPTIALRAAADSERRQWEMLFLAAANSLVVDWFVRRVVTTSLNFFILLDVPLPGLDPASPAGRRLVELAERLVAAESAPGCQACDVALDRAEVDLLICAAYRIDLADLLVLLADFPLLDRRQPALPGEARSTVTADLLAGLAGDPVGRERYAAAARLGAVAYVPAEFAACGGAPLAEGAVG